MTAPQSSPASNLQMKTITFCTAFLCLAPSLLAQSTIAVVNGASFARNAPVAPGSIATAFGNFTGIPATLAATIPLPTELAGVRVSVNNVDAPLFYVGPGQINFQVPVATDMGLATVRVFRGGQDAGSGPVNVFDTAPGIFERSARPNPLGAVLNQNNTPNTQATPARRGEVIQIFATGPGPVSNPLGNGRPAPANTTTITAPKVYVSVLEAPLQYSGLSSEFAGLWQLNAVVPERSFISGQVPLVINHNGIESNVVTIYVAE